MAPTEPPPTLDSNIKMEKKETPYGKQIVATLNHIILFNKKSVKENSENKFLEDKISTDMKTTKKRLLFSRKSSVKLDKLKKNELFRWRNSVKKEKIETMN